MDQSTAFCFWIQKALMHMIKLYVSVFCISFIKTCLSIHFVLIVLLWQGTYSTQIFSLAVLLSSMFVYNQVSFGFELPFCCINFIETDYVYVCRWEALMKQLWIDYLLSLKWQSIFVWELLKTTHRLQSWDNFLQSFCGYCGWYNKLSNDFVLINY